MQPCNIGNFFESPDFYALNIFAVPLQVYDNMLSGWRSMVDRMIFKSVLAEMNDISAQLC